MLRLLLETPDQTPAREDLLDRCFPPNRHLKTSEHLRRGRQPAEGLAFSLFDGPRLIGCVRLWNVSAGSAGPALLLGPVAVDPEWRREGWGAMLMRHAVEEAGRLGHAAIILIGNPPYYTRFGFRHGLTDALIMPGPVDRARFLGLELVPGALKDARGRVIATGVPQDALTDEACAASSLPPAEQSSAPGYATAR